MPFFASSYNTWLPNLWSRNKTNYTFLKLLFLPDVQLIIECCCFSSSISLSKRYSRKLFFPRKQKSIRTYKSTIYAIPSCFYYRRTIPVLIYYEISFSNFQTCMPEGLLPEVPRSVLKRIYLDGKSILHFRSGARQPSPAFFSPASTNRHHHYTHP